MTTEPPKRFLQSLNMSLDVIDEIAKADRPLGVTEIASALGLSKGAVHTVLMNLEARGYVWRGPRTLAFTLGRRLWQLGLEAGRIFDMGALVHDDLVRIANLTGETAQIVSYVSPGEIMFLYRIVSRHPVQAMIPIGDRVPASTTSSGLVLLAHQPEEELENVLRQPIVKLTKKSIASEIALRQALNDIKRDGYAIHAGMHYLDTVTLGVPLSDHSGMSTYALSVYGPEYRFSTEVAQSRLPEIIELAKPISYKLGHRAY